MKYLLGSFAILFSISASSYTDSKITLDSNESVYVINQGVTTKISCKPSRTSYPTPSQDANCKIIPVWRNGLFYSFQLIVKDLLWEEFSMLDYGNNRVLALKKANQERSRIYNQGLCHN
ncbi:MAG: hypothetical protein QF441_09410 [Bacteriovoracaceae bacterium]|jgi:hypothetical protein|nr:hypothetical protein [Bacteriovoracaceae bacterium]